MYFFLRDMKLSFPLGKMT